MAQSRPWTAADVPDQAGRTAVVTGASAGIGLETARVLAARGANVILACRDRVRAERAADQIRAGLGPVSLSIVQLDLASLASVRSAAAEIRAACPRLDPLINNAGVMAVPYARTADGLELTFATDPAARGAEYYGPSGRKEYTGSPVLVESSPRSHDTAVAARLWDVSQELTGVSYPMPLRLS